MIASFDALDACCLGGIFTCALGICWERRWIIRVLRASFAYSQAVEICAVSATVLKLIGRRSFSSKAIASSARHRVSSAFCCAALRSPSMFRGFWLVFCVMIGLLHCSNECFQAGDELLALLTHANVAASFQNGNPRFFLMASSFEKGQRSRINSGSTQVQKFLGHFQRL